MKKQIDMKVLGNHLTKGIGREREFDNVKSAPQIKSRTKRVKPFDINKV